MSRYLLLLLFSVLVLHSACIESPQVVSHTNSAAADTLSPMLPVCLSAPATSISYTTAKTKVSARRQALNAAFATGTIGIDSVQMAFSEMLLHQIIPYWYGTPWSFEGHTETPGTGKVACGYFVSTTLRDLRLPINRYKLAQQAPADEASMLSFGVPVQYLSGRTENWMQDTLSQYIIRDGVYFIGLSNSHVGYLLREKGQFYAIHANYYAPNTVVIRQPLSESVYRLFSEIYIVPLTWNDGLVQAWVTGKIR